MKLSRVLLTAMLLGTLAMFGCGDDSGDLCGNCATEAQRNECEREAALCETARDPGVRDACFAAAADICL